MKYKRSQSDRVWQMDAKHLYSASFFDFLISVSDLH